MDVNRVIRAMFAFKDEMMRKEAAGLQSVARAAASFIKRGVPVPKNIEAKWKWTRDISASKRHLFYSPNTDLRRELSSMARQPTVETATPYEFGQAMQAAGYQSRVLPKDARNRIKDLSRLEGVVVPNMNFKNYLPPRTTSGLTKRLDRAGTYRGIVHGAEHPQIIINPQSAALRMRTPSGQSLAGQTIDHEFGHHVDYTTRPIWKHPLSEQRHKIRETFADDYAQTVYPYKPTNSAKPVPQQIDLRRYLANRYSGRANGIYSTSSTDFSVPAGMTPGQIVARRLANVESRMSDPVKSLAEKEMAEAKKYYRFG